jgi:Antibiotic biosynthesis monooxygenase
MQYTQVTTITTKAGQMAEFLHRAEAEILPLHRAMPGFVAFTVTKTGESTAVTFGIWQTQQQAQEAVKTSNRWMNQVKTRIRWMSSGGSGDVVDGVHNYVSELPFLAFSSDLRVYSSPPLANSEPV